MIKILEEVLSQIPDKKLVSNSCFEGANIILYTKDKEFFLTGSAIIKNIVNSIKKRIELRPDPSITLEMEKAKEKIEKILPKDAGISEIIFDAQRSIVIIEAEKPGLAIGKQGELLREIKKETFWIPFIRRTPAIRSKIIENIRRVLYENNDYRKKFLNNIGERIYGGWTKDKKNEWVRVSFLGGGRQVGRSCILLQTPESKVLLDCGVNVAADEKNAYPILDAPEFNIQALDAVILTHPHIDHSGFIPWLYKMGYKGPLYCTKPTRDISALLALDFIGIAQKEAKKGLFGSRDVKEMVKHTICLDYEEVSDITPDIRITLYNAGHTIGSAMVHLHIGNGLHNLLYSLDWKTPVTVIDKEDNVIFKPIGEIIDNQFNKLNFAIKKGIAEELPNLDGFKTIVFNPETYKTEIKPITSFIRHPINEDLYELKTASGRKITVTKSHSVFSVKDGEVVEVKVKDLDKGDFIIGPKKIPLLNREPELNLLEYAPKLRIRVNNSELLDNILSGYKTRFSELKENDKNEALNWIIEHYKFAKYKNEIARKYKVHMRRVRRVFNQLGIKEHPRVKHIFSEKLKINKDFARFLGYHVAEGHVRKNSQTICISNFNHKILEDCYKIIKDNFGIIGDLRYKENVVLFNSKQLKYLVSNILKCGKNAYNKRVPSQILLSSQEIISNFLYGYFSGDGGIINKKDDKGRSIFASSVNYDLIQDITFLLLQFGLVPTITYNKYNKIYTASIYNSTKIKEFVEKIGIENKHLVNLIPKLARKKNKGSFDLRIPILSFSKKGQLMLSKTSWQNSKSSNSLLLGEIDFPDLDKKLIKSDFMFDQIKEIKKVKPTKKYVYDFKVEGYENFLSGSGLFLHNTGDMKYLRTQSLEPAAIRFPRLETVIIESTYGSKNDILPSRKSCEVELINYVKKTLARGGKVLIPVLGTGRSQEVMLILEKAVREGLLSDVPIYVQGMVWDITAIHTGYPDFLNRNVRKNIFHRDANPFLNKCFKWVGSKKEQDFAIEEAGPCVIMATSGMMTGGSSVEYFKRLCDNDKNSILFVCYQGEGSLGRRIQNGEKDIIIPIGIKTDSFKVKMEVNTIAGLTGHAGRNELTRFIYNLNPKPKKIIVNHGESSKCLELASTLHKLNRIETVAPKNLEAVRLR